MFWQWNPQSLDKVDDEKLDLVFKPFKEDLELQIAEKEDNRCLYPHCIIFVSVNLSPIYSIREMKNFIN